MSLRQIVVGLITEIGGGTVDDIMPRLVPMGYTRDQAMKAIHNAFAAGYLWNEGIVPRRGKKHTDHRPSVYRPTSVAKPVSRYEQLMAKNMGEQGRPLVSSVFDLANPKHDWPAGSEGRVFLLLSSGDVEEEEAA